MDALGTYQATVEAWQIAVRARLTHRAECDARAGTTCWVCLRDDDAVDACLGRMERERQALAASTTAAQLGTAYRAGLARVRQLLSPEPTEGR